MICIVEKHENMRLRYEREYFFYDSGKISYHHMLHTQKEREEKNPFNFIPLSRTNGVFWFFFHSLLVYFFLLLLQLLSFSPLINFRFYCSEKKSLSLLLTFFSHPSNNEREHFHFHLYIDIWGEATLCGYHHLNKHQLPHANIMAWNWFSVCSVSY